MSTARDADERDRWIRALESTIQRLSGYYRIRGKAIVIFFANLTKLQ